MNTRRGTTLVELLVYIGILAIATVLVVNAILKMTEIFGKARVERKVALAAETALERMVREIRLANDVPVIQSSPPYLALNTFADYTGSTAVTKIFILPLGSKTLYYDNDAYDPYQQVPLTPSDVQVTSLTFTQLPFITDKPKAVRITLTITGGSGKYAVSHNYYATAVLRGAIK